MLNVAEIEMHKYRALHNNNHGETAVIVVNVHLFVLLSKKVKCRRLYMQREVHPTGFGFHTSGTHEVQNNVLIVVGNTVPICRCSYLLIKLRNHCPLMSQAQGHQKT